MIYAGKDCEKPQRTCEPRLSGRCRKADIRHQIPETPRNRVSDPSELAYGGVIGSVFDTGIVTAHRSRRFRGPTALALKDPRPARFRPTEGQLGLFRLT